jgi:hypothetical protein
MENNTPTTSPEPDAYKISLTGPGISVERSIPVDKALQIVAIVLGGTAAAQIPRSSGSPAAIARPFGESDRRKALREFWDEVEPKRMPDRIVTIGCYLQRFSGQESFTRDDVKRQFRVAGEAIPGNLHRDWTWAVANGWIAEVHDAPGFFYVTSKGEKAVDSGFPADIKKGTSLTRRIRPKKQRAAKQPSGKGK